MKPLYGKDSVIPNKKKIVFFGDSITDEGTYIAFMDAYLLQHWPGHEITLINLGVSSETASGLSEPEHPFPRPCVHDRLVLALEESKPDWVVLCYGMNDGIYYPFSNERFEAYQSGILRAVELVKAADAKAILMTPPPFDGVSYDAPMQPEGQTDYSYAAPFARYEEVLKRYADWVLTLHGRADAVVSIHDPLLELWSEKREKDPDYVTGDGIHPGAEGHWVIARELLRVLFNVSLQQVPQHVLQPEQSPIFAAVAERHRLLSSAWKEHVGHTNPSKADALPLNIAIERGENLAEQIRDIASKLDVAASHRRSQWKGYERIDFMLEGREGLVVFPKTFAEGKPWIWRASFFDAFSYADMALLEQGWAIAYDHVSDMYGAPGAVAHMRVFQDYVTEAFELSAKTVLFGFSRGGLYSCNYAIAHPEQVKMLYLDAPVLDILSWPAGRGAGTRSEFEWQECLAVYGVNEETVSGAMLSPIDNVQALAATNIPILIVAGDADIPVPLCENGAPFAERFRELGGIVSLIVKPGVGHHPHSLEDPSPILAFIRLYS